ncbi:phage tail tube protein [Sporohalobacter salinus]|uniref:phage tail tube protein n=1 Tax=Sporohalobacter salinus TaxID=1494606 RepID=UPI00195F6E0A|nr:phage tail tube protein [Sporohalobacter salinus]MBM7623719.1 hypothetical protein [Sporohalobacter salinus]
MIDREDPQILRYFGIGLEKDYGKKSSPVQFMDIASSSLDSPTETEIDYTGGLSRGARVHRPGAYIPEGDITYAVDIHSIGYLLMLTLGNWTQSGPDKDNYYIYEMTNKKNGLVLPSATVYLGKDLFEHQFTGACVDQLELSIEDEYAEATISFKTSKDKKGSLRKEKDLILPEAYPLVFYDMNLKLDGESRGADLENLTLTINNNTDAEAGIGGAGSRFPQMIYAGDIEVSFDLDLAFNTMKEKESFWGGKDGPAKSGSKEQEIIISMDSGKYGSLELKMPRTVYQEVAVQPEGRDRLTQSISGKAYFSNKIDAVIKAILKNKLNYFTNAVHDLYGSAKTNFDMTNISLG